MSFSATGRLFVGVVTPFALLAFLSPQAHAQSLGAASDYNIWVFENHTASNVDVHGKVAVGGNATYGTVGNYNGLTLGSLEGSGPHNVNTVVGGNFLNNGHSAKGTVAVGGNARWHTPTVSGDLRANGSVDLSGGGGSVNGVAQYGTTYSGPAYINHQQGTTPLPVDFAAARTDLTNFSNDWGSLATTGTATSQWSQLFFTASAGLNVINVTTAQLAGATGGFNWTGPSSATLLINVTDAGSGSITIPNTGTNFAGGMSVANVLYNFTNPGLATINLQGSFNGSILAPHATLTGTYGAFNGQAIVKNLHAGSVEFHKVSGGNTYFTGDLPKSRIPEPGSLALLALCLPGALLLRRRKA